MPILVIMKNSNTNICLCRFDLLISSKAESAQLVIRLLIQVGTDKLNPLVTFYNMHRCRTAHDLSKTINEHIFIGSLEELVSFTVWLWSGYPQDDTNHDTVHFHAKFTLKQGSHLDVLKNVFRPLKKTVLIIKLRLFYFFSCLIYWIYLSNLP